MRPLPAAIALMIAPSLAATAHQAAAAKPVAPPCAILVARLGDAGDQLGACDKLAVYDGRNACLAAWASSLERATTTACRTAVESGAAPEVLDALRRLVASPVKQAVFQEGATDLACRLRPAGALDLFDLGLELPRRRSAPLPNDCLAALLEAPNVSQSRILGAFFSSSGRDVEAPPIELVTAIATVVPRLSPGAMERLAPALDEANLHRAVGRDALYRGLCVAHQPQGAALQQACGRLGADREPGWRREENATATRAVRAGHVAQTFRRLGLLAAVLLLGGLYVFFAWRWRHRGWGSAVACAGVMGVAIASAYKTQHDVHGDGTAHIIGVMGALILVGLGFVLGLLALVPKLRLVVVALAVIGSFWLLRC